MSRRQKWRGRRVPPPAGDLQLNRCRSIHCENFGVLPNAEASLYAKNVDAYMRMGTSRADNGPALPALLCQRCQVSVTMLSNLAIAEERDRLLALSRPTPAGACKTEGCPNVQHDVAHYPEIYQRFGATPSGSLRYRCRACSRTFSTPVDGTHRLRRPEKTLEIFKALINKVPMRRLCELADVRAETLYQRIGLIYDRCREFGAAHETKLLAGGLIRERMHLATDRQELYLNSGTSQDSRSTLLLSCASAEGSTGYVVAQHVNFDPDADPFLLELNAREAGDPEAPAPFRRYARLWLPYQRFNKAEAKYEEDTATGTEFRPTTRGTQVHDTIAMAAHFQVLEQMTRGANYVQLSMDREPGIERLAILTFLERVRTGTCDAYFVRIAKETSLAQKRLALSEAEAVLREAKAAHSDVAEAKLLFRLIEERYERAILARPQARDRWVSHPYPTMSEPQRDLLCLTDDGRRPRHQIVAGFARASLRSIDRYFMQVRRKIHVLERPISSSSAANRKWYGYSAYSPLVVMRLLEIFRIVYNYHLVGQQTTTPAQRLGLANEPISLAKLVGMSD